MVDLICLFSELWGCLFLFFDLFVLGAFCAAACICLMENVLMCDVIDQFLQAIICLYVPAYFAYVLAAHVG